MKKFIFPNHQSHRIYREMTQQCPMYIEQHNYIRYDLRALPDKYVDYLIDYYPHRDVLVDEGYRNIFRASGGINLAGFRVELRNNYPIRHIDFRFPGGYHDYKYDYDHPVAFEVLIYGIGQILLKKSRFQSTFRVIMSENGEPNGLPVVRSTQAVFDHKTLVSEYNGKLVEYYSTNQITADVYGELENIARQTDTKILETYLETMQFTFGKKKDTGDSNLNSTDCWYDIRWRDHVKNGTWNSPPTSIEELLERVHYILDNTLIDDSAYEMPTLLERVVI